MASAAMTDLELSSHVDGETSEEKRAAIEDWLQRSPGAALRVAAFHRQNALIRHAFGVAPAAGAQRHPRAQAGGTRRPLRDLAAEPLRQPDRATGLRQAQRGRLVLVTAGSFFAGAAVALVAAAFLGFAPAFVDGARMIGARPVEAIFIADPLQALVGRAVAAHRLFALDATKPVEFEAQGEALMRQLSPRAGVSVDPPDLSAAGLRLLGGRMVPGDPATAILLVYESGGGERTGLFVSHGGGLAAPEPRFVEATINAAVWTEGATFFALTGRSPRPTLAALAETIRAHGRAPGPAR